MGLKRIYKYYYYRIIRLQGNPRALAGGASIGVLIGFTPTMPFHTILILLLAFVTRTSVIAAIIMSWVVCNPLTFIPIYYLSVMFGNSFTPFQIDWYTMKVVIDSILNSDGFYAAAEILLNIGYEATTVLLTGGLILAVPLSIISYFIMLRFFKKLHKKRTEKVTKQNLVNT